MKDKCVGSSDASGNFKIWLGLGTHIINVYLHGYAPFQTEVVVSTNNTHLRPFYILAEEVQTFDSKVGANLTFKKFGVMVDFGQKSILDAYGEVYEGEVISEIAFLNSSNSNHVRSMPNGFRGYDSINSTQQVFFESYNALHFDLRDK